MAKCNEEKTLKGYEEYIHEGHSHEGHGNEEYIHEGHSHEGHGYEEYIHEGHSHEEQHTHGHNHVHNPENMKKISNRLAKAIGHLEAVKRMVEDNRDCSEVLIQLAAVKSAINNTGKEILKEHISHCIIDAIENGDDQAIKELNNAIDKFMK